MDEKLITLENLKEFKEKYDDKVALKEDISLFILDPDTGYLEKDHVEENCAILEKAAECYDNNKPFIIEFDGWVHHEFYSLGNDTYTLVFMSLDTYNPKQTSNANYRGIKYVYGGLLSYTYNRKKKTITNDVDMPFSVMITEDKEKIIASDNTKSWTPSTDYGLVHKKYVDDAIANVSGGNEIKHLTYKTSPGMFEMNVLNYPTGYNKSNCIVSSIGVELSDGTIIYGNMSNPNDNYYDTPSVNIALDSSGITIVTGASSSSSTKSITVHIYLTKIA